jgi:hypothetical protein
MTLWGFKTEAAFDVWSLEHLLSGIATAAFADLFIKKFFHPDNLRPGQRLALVFILTLLAAVFWECCEHYIEAGVLPGSIGAAVTYWFQGVEHWTNRIIADNLMVLLGAFIYVRQNRLALFGKIFSFLWLGVHIFIFPHSMYLHTLMGK